MADQKEEALITLTIKSTKQKFDIDILPSEKVSKLKTLLKEKIGEDVKGELCLIFAGKILKDEDTLTSHGLIKSGLTVHLVIRAAKPQAPPPSVNTSGGVSTTPTQSSTASGVPHPPVPPTNPFSMFGGGASLSPDMQAQMQQLAANPDMMRQIMESPMMQSLMSNPEALSSIITSNPQMQQLMERNPELSHALHNPDLMRQAMEMATNQSAMRELLRSQDRQLSNIESLPGGFNALARMYSEVQEPMLDAAQESLQQQLQNNPFAALFQGQQNTPQPGPAAPPGTTNTAPLPNPWGGGSTANNSSTTGGSSGSSNQSTTPSSGSGQVPNLLGGGASGNGQRMPSGLEMLSNPAYREMYQRSMADPQTRQMLSRMVQNPAFVQQMMQSMPPAMRESMGNDPEAMARLMQQSSEMFNNPQMLELMSNPEALQGMMRMMEGYQQMANATGGTPLSGLGSMFGQQQQPTSSSSSTPMAGIIPPPNLALLSQLFGQQQQSPIGTPSNTTSANNTAAANTGTNSSTGGTNTGSVGGGDELSMEERLAQRFRVQLGILESMGFVERTANIQALKESNGDINAAIDKLINMRTF